jgi:flagellar motility protein MotE (MotC chaperone)
VTIEIPAVLAALTAIFTLAAAGGAAWAVARSAAAKASVDLMSTINAELRADNEQLRQQLHREELLREKDRHDCDRQIAEVRGQLKALETSLTEEIGVQIGVHVGEQLVKLMGGRNA